MSTLHPGTISNLQVFGQYCRFCVKQKTLINLVWWNQVGISDLLSLIYYIIMSAYPNCTACTAGTAGGNCGWRPSSCRGGSSSPAKRTTLFYNPRRRWTQFHDCVFGNWRIPLKTGNLTEIGRRAENLSAWSTAGYCVAGVRMIVFPPCNKTLLNKWNNHSSRAPSQKELYN